MMIAMNARKGRWEERRRCVYTATVGPPEVLVVRTRKKENARKVKSKGRDIKAQGIAIVGTTEHRCSS